MYEESQQVKKEAEVAHEEMKETKKASDSAKGGVSINLRLDKETLKMGILVALIIVSGVQTFQLSALKGGTVKTAKPSATTQPSSSSGGSALPASLQNLPSQVGGC